MPAGTQSRGRCGARNGTRDGGGPTVRAVRGRGGLESERGLGAAARAEAGAVARLCGRRGGGHRRADTDARAVHLRQLQSSAAVAAVDDGTGVIEGVRSSCG